MAFIRYYVLLFLKWIIKKFYKINVQWVGEEKDLGNVRVVLLLNHTSLFEPIYVGALPNSFIKRLATKGSYCIAEETLNRPIAGTILKSFAADVVPISRKRDASWSFFLENAGELVLMAPEGRMKRPNGLDKHGKKMSVRSGTGDLLDQFDSGDLLIGYSGGLHHVQKPGDLFPRIGKKIALALEVISISEYKKSIATDELTFRKAVARDLDKRRDENCPNIKE